jgi:hypothetical protein
LAALPAAVNEMELLFLEDEKKDDDEDKEVRGVDEGGM